MYRKPPKKVEILKRTASYSAMSLAVIAIATMLVFFLLGYRRDWSSGQIEQSGLVQFNSIPSGASVSIDTSSLGSSTPTKANVLPGSRFITVSREGYIKWSKTVDVRSGTLLWLDYVRLVPALITSETVKTFGSLVSSLPSPDNKKLLIKSLAQDYNFELVNISGDNPGYQTISLPASVTKDFGSNGSVALVPIRWDSDSRHVLVRVDYSNKKQWIVLDTKQPDRSRNISTSLGVEITDVDFFGTSGNIFYAITGSDLRKLDLSGGTISRSLATNVESMKVYDDRIVTYIGSRQIDSVGYRVAGIYKDGDESPMTAKIVPADTKYFAISLMDFHSNDYVSVLVNQQVEIFRGSLPASGVQFSETMNLYDSFETNNATTGISFSSDARFMLLPAGDKYKSYSIEQKTTNDYTINGSTWGVNTLWFDEAHIYSTIDGKLTMRDYDGTNAVNIMDVTPGMKASLSSSDKYVYSFKKTTSGYELVRAKIVL